jgi:hypothetical protein
MTLKPTWMTLSLLAMLPVATAAAEQCGTHWSHYVNNHYQLALCYPANMQPRKTFSNGYFFNKNWSVSDNAKSQNNPSQHALFEIPLQNKHGANKAGGGYYAEAFVRVGVSTDPLDVENCEKATDVLTYPTTARINDVKFSVFTFADAGMSQFINATVYRYATDNECYSIEYIQTGSNAKNIQHDLSAQKIAHKIISSLKIFDT